MVDSINCVDTYKKFSLTDQMLKRVWDESSRIQIYNGSRRGRNGNFIGLLGEKIVHSWLKENQIDCVCENQIDHDIKSGKHRIEVKTKDRTVDPLPHYEASVPQYVYEAQAPDFYFFVSLKRDRNARRVWYRTFRVGFILGYLSREEFNRVKYSEKRGYKSNGAYFFCDAWNCKISDLRQPAEVLKFL